MINNAGIASQYGLPGSSSVIAVIMHVKLGQRSATGNAVSHPDD